MSKLDANRSPERRLDEFIKQISAPEIKGNINQPAEKTSRWIKWGFNTAGATIPGYQIVKKSESNIFNRLLDRIDSVAGQARQEANKEISRMLKDSGVVVTKEIKRHLPDKHKLGNAQKLAYEIKSAIAAKEATKKETQEKINREMPETIKKHVQNLLATKEPLRDILRNDSVEKRQFRLYMQPLFQNKVSDFVRNFVDKLKEIKGPMTQIELKKLISSKQTDFFHKITDSKQWAAVQSMFIGQCDIAIDNLTRDDIYAVSQGVHILDDIKKLSPSILTFAGLNVFMADAVASSEDELNAQFCRLLNAEDQPKVLETIGYFSRGLNDIASGSSQ